MNFYDILLARCLCCKAGSEEELLEVTENGQYVAPEGKAFNPVIVSVPLPSGTLPITENGIYDVYSYASVDVDVAGVCGITADEVALRTISGAISGSASYIGSYAFYSCSSITEANFPNCTNIGSYAFYSCSSLTEVSFPVCTSIGAGAFQTCSSLTEVSFPACTSIGAGAFQTCSSLTEVSFPVCTSIGSYAFYSCSSLTEVSFPVCTSIRASAFYSCYSLTEVSFPACTSIGEYAFQTCSSLTEVSFPACTSIGVGAFQTCRSLVEVSFPVCRSIDSNAFRSCYNLLSFNLVGVSSVPTLKGSVFYSTPIGGYTGSTGGVYGSVYVPSSLLTAFQTAPSWSLISSRIVGV